MLCSEGEASPFLKLTLDGIISESKKIKSMIKYSSIGESVNLCLYNGMDFGKTDEWLIYEIGYDIFTKSKQIFFIL